MQHTYVALVNINILSDFTRYNDLLQTSDYPVTNSRIIWSDAVTCAL